MKKLTIISYAGLLLVLGLSGCMQINSNNRGLAPCAKPCTPAVPVGNPTTTAVTQQHVTPPNPTPQAANPPPAPNPPLSNCQNQTLLLSNNDGGSGVPTANPGVSNMTVASPDPAVVCESVANPAPQVAVQTVAVTAPVYVSAAAPTATYCVYYSPIYRCYYYAPANTTLSLSLDADIWIGGRWVYGHWGADRRFYPGHQAFRGDPGWGNPYPGWHDGGWRNPGPGWNGDPYHHSGGFLGGGQPHGNPYPYDNGRPSGFPHGR